MLGKGKFHYWKLPHDDSFTVLWIKLAAPQQLEFLEWCERSSIPLYVHAVTHNFLLPSVDRKKVAGRKITDREQPKLVDFAEARKAWADHSSPKTHASWYMVETCNDEHLMLIKMKWQ